jgi:4'-phosphopantetheinyl transferase
MTRPTSLVLSESGAGEDRLTAVERERRARLRRPGDRDDFLAAHLVVRQCVGRLLGVAPAEVVIEQRCTTCGGPHGRPEVAGHPEVRASLAHSAGVVAAAAGTAPLGVDVETVGPVELAPDDVSIAFGAAEIAAIEAAPEPGRALRLAWVRKEACLKAGLVELDGLADYDLAALPLDPPRGDRALRAVSLGSWTVHDWWDGRTGAVGAVLAPAGAAVTLSG